MPVRVVTDSACDVPQALADELGLVVVPLTVRFGAEQVLDRRELTPTEFWARLAGSAERPETAAPSPAQFEAAYHALIDAGADGIVVVAVSTLLSGAAQSAQLAAASLAGSVTVSVVDSRTTTGGLGMVAVAAARAAAAGVGPAAVAALAEDLATRTKVIAVVDTPDRRRRHAILAVRGGRIEEVGRHRTRQAAVRHVTDRVIAAGTLEDLAVLHAEAPDLDDVVARLAPLAPGPLMVVDIGAAFGARCGPAAIGVAYQALHA